MALHVSRACRGHRLGVTRLYGLDHACIMLEDCVDIVAGLVYAFRSYLRPLDCGMYTAPCRAHPLLAICSSIVHRHSWCNHHHRSQCCNRMSEPMLTEAGAMPALRQQWGPSYQRNLSNIPVAPHQVNQLLCPVLTVHNKSIEELTKSDVPDIRCGDMCTENSSRHAPPQGIQTRQEAMVVQPV